MPAPGETSLTRLLSTLTTTVHPSTYVFVTLPSSSPIPTDLDPVMHFRESEGVTLIVTKQAADSHGFKAEFPCRMITLNVHSSLDAVGFLAIITRRLADKGMGCNPVSGFHHDHLFVPEDRVDEAAQVLREIATESASA